MRVTSLTVVWTLLTSGLTWAADCSAPPTKPTRGTSCTDTVHGGTLTRATNHTADSISNFARNDYSRRQAFNADKTRFIVYGGDGGNWYLYNAATMAKVKSLSGAGGLGGDAEPQWHPTDPNLIRYFPNNGGLVIKEYDISDDSITTIADFTGRLPWPSAEHCWTGAEGSPSSDHRYWAFKCENSSWATVGIFTYDLQTDTILATLSETLGDPDAVSMTPTGNYVVVMSEPPYRIRAYTRALDDWSQIACTGSHSDIALDVDGFDNYVAVDYSGAGDPTCGNGYLFRQPIKPATWVSEGKSTGRVDLFPLGWTYDLGGLSTVRSYHVSGKSYDRPGHVIVSTVDCRTGNGGTCPTSLDDMIFDVALSDGSITMLAGTQNKYYNYWTEPHASVARDGSRIIFNSNWDAGGTADDDVDAYILDIPLTFTITTTTMANGTAGQSYQADVQTTGGTQPVTACITTAGALPTGASWSVQGSACRLTDASADSGTHNFTLQATDSNSNTDTQAFTLTITAVLTIDTTTLPDGTQGSGYSQALSISGGTPPYTCTVQSGSLPAGASLSGTGDCTISASNLTTTGTSSFTIRATDDVAATDDQALSITVGGNPGVLMMTPIIQPLATSVVVTTGGTGLDQAADCQGILRDGVGATVDTQTSMSGSARRRLYFTGLTASTTYSLTLTCDGAQPDVTPYPFVTKPAPSGGNRTVPIQLGAPGITLTGVARCSVEYDDNPELSSPAPPEQNTNCASGGTINLTIPAGLYWYRTLWQTAADATLATSAIQPLLVE